MCPLCLCEANKEMTIAKINVSEKTNEEIAKRISTLGFIEGDDIFIISKMGKNYIVCVKGCRYAIGDDIVKRISVIEKGQVRKLEKR